MTCNFTPFSTKFQSYNDEVIAVVEKISTSSRQEPRQCQYELQSAGTQSDRPYSVFTRANKNTAIICKHSLCDDGSTSYSGIDASMQ